MSQPGTKQASGPKKSAQTKKAPQPKTVEIKVSSNGSCSPDPAHVYQIDSIRWTGDVSELEFSKEHPFEPAKGPKFKPHAVHKVHKSAGKFKYSVTTSTGKYDPEIIVDPPPPGG